MLPDFRVRQRDYLLEIARALTQELNLEQLLGRILKISIEMLAGQAGLIALRETSTGWSVNVSNGLPARFVKAINNSLKAIPLETAPEKAELPEVNRILRHFTNTVSQGVLNGVGLPLMTRGQLVGVIYVFRRYRDDFSANDHSLLSSFANQAAIAVQNAKAYAQLSQDKQRLSALLDANADGILILDARLRIERCNPAFSRMLGLPVNVIVGRRYQEIMRWARTPVERTLEDAVAGGWPENAQAYLYVEGDLQRPDARPSLPVSISYSPLIDESGSLLNILASVRDMTRFRQADEAKSTFISIITHELKTPVALIKGYASTLRRDDASWDPEIVQESLAVIEEESDRLSNMIENLLDASRLQAGGLEIKPTDVNLAHLARRAAAKMQTQTQRHEITVDFPDDFPIVLADEQRIEQVLTNLISNSIRYAPGGEIHLAGRVEPGVVVISVLDEGPGISTADLPFVFERFYRSPETARNTKGAGLGLYLARALVEAHGGKMWADRDQEHGGRIHFSLPR